MAKKTPFRLLLAVLLLLAPLLAAHAGQDVVLLLDNSSSMRVNDPHRLAVRAAREFADKRGADTRIAVIGFDLKPDVLLPLTVVNAQSREHIRRALTRLTYRGRGTDTAAALERALYLLDHNGSPDAQRFIILMSDGFINVGSHAGNQQKLRWIHESLIPEAAAGQIHIFAIAFTKYADYELLQTLAQKTGGDYFRVFRDRDLAGAFRQMGETLAAEAPPVPFNTPLTDVTQRNPGSPSVLWLILLTVLAVLAVVLGGYVAWSLRRLQRPVDVILREVQRTEGPRAVLYDIGNPDDIKRYELIDRTAVIGRHAGYDPEVQYILVNDSTVGRCHAVIERRGLSFWISDQGSANGTYVNGERIVGDSVLKDGDVISVHEHAFRFVLPGLAGPESIVFDDRQKIVQAVEPVETWPGRKLRENRG